MSEILNEEAVAKESGVSRRRVVAGVAWTVPVIATAIAAPAAAASGISAIPTLMGAGSGISFVSSTGTGSGTSNTGTGPTSIAITNSGAAFNGTITGTINVKPTGTAAAGAGIQSITGCTLVPANPAYSNTHEYNATFTYPNILGVAAGETLNLPIFFQYERLSGSSPKATYDYTMTVTLRLPDGTSRIITGSLSVTFK